MPREFVIFDTEYTTWEGALQRGWSGENEFREIVQIGAIRVKDLKEVDCFEKFVVPVKNPNLSQFFVELTGVTQEEVDEKGVSFREAVAEFGSWIDGLDCYSYARDIDVWKENADLLEQSLPFSEEKFHDVRDVFNVAGIDTTQYSSGTIPKAFGKTPPPYGHNALNDARSILIALNALSNLSC